MCQHGSTGTSETGADIDARLLAAHRAGDGGAFGELARRHSRLLWITAVRILHDEHDAADAVQEALVAAYRGASGYRGEAAVATWLTRILINGCLERLRRERRRPTQRLGRLDPGAPADLATELTTRIAVHEALARLPATQRVAVVLVDVQGWSVADAAEVLEVPVGTVKSRCARARARLAQLLGHLHTEEVR